MPTRALLFDLDDTLISDTSDARAALDAVCATLEPDAAVRDKLVDSVKETAQRVWAAGSMGGALARELGISAVEALYSDFSGSHDRVAGLSAIHHEFKRTVWSQALTIHGHDLSPAEIDALTDVLRVIRGPHVTVYPEVLDVLDALGATARLGVVTNGPPDLQRLKLAATGLEDRFDVVVISGELGWGKPSVAPFTRAMDALAVQPAATTMVGNSVHHDIAGGRAAGIGVVLVTRPGLAHDTPTDPVEAVVDLQPLLDR